PVTTRGEEGDVDARRVGGGQVLHLHLPPDRLHPGPGGARRGEEADAVGGEPALLEDRDHRPAHRAGGADDCDRAAHDSPSCRFGPSWSPKASCNAATASSIRSARMTQVMRIVEVEIISMSMPRPASVRNMRAATPGWDFMP